MFAIPNSKTKILLIVCLYNTIWLAYATKQLFIDYGVGTEGSELAALFEGVHNGFYVDIGNDNCCFESSTLNLRVMGWNGINVNIHPEKYVKYFMSRPGEINVHFAIGDVEDQFVTLDQVINEDFTTNSNNLQKQIKVPSITLSQLC
jgi:hypothetical protein